ncbi:hypothetical protein ES703_109532 [subsurface metagenome]
MDISDPKTIIIILAAVGIIAAIVIIVFNRRSAMRKDEKRPAEILDPGWQFIPSRPRWMRQGQCSVLTMMVGGILLPI